MAPTKTIKFVYGSEIRRVTVNVPNFQQLGELVKTLFNTSLESVRLSYVDSEGDKIIICSQPEWETILQEPTLPKINVETSVPSTEASFKQSQNQNHNQNENQNCSPSKPLIFVKLIVEPKYAQYGITVDEATCKEAEGRFHLTLQKYFGNQRIHPDNLPSMFKKSITFLYVSEKAVVVEVGIARFYKALFRKAVELVSFAETIPQGKQIFLEISELLQHPAVCWALAYVELLSNNLDKAKEYLQMIFQFNEELRSGLDSHDFFESFSESALYSQLVDMFTAMSDEYNTNKWKEECSNKWKAQIEVLKGFGIEMGDRQVELLDSCEGKVDLFLNQYFD
eukprot:TRINITY_DN2452_c0_g1_i1.p1 TRINITY_DN2452_c0_g1~~TRINITY_DN2452_c0_g1_i1.p1  ORF type:complete len:338 (+),score=48.92 TRINITY_DN2452_c0_g1_i1:158-1171(+)